MKPTPWSEILENWKAGEDNEAWHDYYQKKGFKNWADWRWPIIQTLHLDQLEWDLEELKNPIEEVRAMYCNALTRWKDFYTDRNKSTFGDLASHPFFQNHKRVMDLKADFQSGTQLIALRRGRRVIVIDGHHRSMALAQTPDRNPKDQPLVRLAVSDFGPGEKTHFDQIWGGDATLQMRRKALTLVGIARSQIGGLKIFSK